MNKIEKLPGWDMEIDETTNNVYQFLCQHPKGYKSDCSDHDFDRGLQKCLEGAFEIEQKVGKNGNKFLYDTFMLLIEENAIKESRYQENVFGSWYIEGKRQRIVLEGRDYEIAIEEKVKRMLSAGWKTIKRYRDLGNLKLPDLERISIEFEEQIE